VFVSMRDRHDSSSEGARAHRTRARGALDRETLARLVREDLSVRQIAAEVDRSPTTVRHWLSRHGLRTSDTARARRHHAPRPRQEARCSRHGTSVHVLGTDGILRCTRCRADDVTEWRRRTKRRLVEEAGGACVMCGFAGHPAALQFHHLDPTTKSFGLGGRGLTRSIERLRIEAAKCVLLCANCHALVEVGALHLPATDGRATMTDGPDRG
jgi:hypothetical protein